MGTYPVTVGQFKAFVRDYGYQTEAETDGQGGWGYDAANRWFAQDPKYTWKDPGWEQTDALRW